MPDLDLFAEQFNGNHIEPADDIVQRVNIIVHDGNALELCLLAAIDRCFGRTIAIVRASFYLDEDECLTIVSNNIDLAYLPKAKVTLDDSVSERSDMFAGVFFAFLCFFGAGGFCLLGGRWKGFAFAFKFEIDRIGYIHVSSASSLIMLSNISDSWLYRLGLKVRRCSGHGPYLPIARMCSGVL